MDAGVRKIARPAEEFYAYVRNKFEKFYETYMTFVTIFHRTNFSRHFFAESVLATTPPSREQIVARASAVTGGFSLFRASPSALYAHIAYTLTRARRRRRTTTVFPSVRVARALNIVFAANGNDENPPPAGQRRFFGKVIGVIYFFTCI